MLITVTALALVLLSALAVFTAVRQQAQILYGGWFAGYLVVLVAGQVTAAVGLWLRRLWALFLALAVMTSDQLFELYLGEGGWVSFALRVAFSACLLVERRWFR